LGALSKRDILAFTQNGTCYTKDECEEREGTSSGTCAEGYGVCCTCKLACTIVNWFHVKNAKYQFSKQEKEMDLK